jgi:hypothetical protein
MKPNPKEINIILNILKGAQFEFLPRAPFYIDTPLGGGILVGVCIDIIHLTSSTTSISISYNIFTVRHVINTENHT